MEELNEFAVTFMDHVWTLPANLGLKGSLRLFLSGANLGGSETVLRTRIVHASGLARNRGALLAAWSFGQGGHLLACTVGKVKGVLLSEEW